MVIPYVLATTEPAASGGGGGAVFWATPQAVATLAAVVLSAVLVPTVIALWRRYAGSRSRSGFVRRWLAATVQQHRHLKSLPTTLVAATQVPSRELEQLYVSLAVKGRAVQGTSSIAEALQKHRLLVLVGDPGSGKTTVLRYLTLSLARAAIASSRLRWLSIPGGERPRYRDALRRVRGEYGLKACPLPLFANLSVFGDVAAWKPDFSLLTALEHHLRGNALPVPEGFVGQRAEKPGCVFFFDAFDELGSHEARDAMAHRIGQLAAAVPGSRIVVASRESGYQGQLAEYGFQIMKIQRLSQEQIRQLLRQWFESMGEPSAAERLLAEFRRKPQIQELAENPMLLSLIALVQSLRRMIPDQRHLLYDECVQILLERRFAAPAVQAEYDRTIGGRDARLVLQEVALAMHLLGKNQIPRREMESRVLPEAVRAAYVTLAPGVDARQLLRNIEQRSQLLIERGFDESGEPLVAFSHLTFQEYLASVALYGRALVQGDDQLREELLARYSAHPEWWEEVVLLYSAQLQGPQRRAYLAAIHPQLFAGAP